MASVVQTQEPPVKEDPLAKHRDNIAQLSEISRNSRTTFLALILACVYSYLAIATTEDAALLSNSNTTPLPIIQTNVPIVWFYYVAPIILAVLFVYFHLYLERFWRCVIRLPLKHPDGRGLDDYVYPWLISNAVIRGEIRTLSPHRIWALAEAWLCLLLAWWLVPIVLLFYWASFLVAHDWVGTLLHLGLIVLTASFALRSFFVARNTLRGMDRTPSGDNAERETDPTQSAGNTDAAAPESIPAPIERMQIVSGASALAIVGAMLVYLSASAIEGLPQDVCKKRDPQTCGFYSPARAIWQAFGVEPYPQVNEERFIDKPKEWQQLLSDSRKLSNYLETQRTLMLVGRNLRGMSATKAFLPGSRIQGTDLNYADLTHAVITGSRLENVDLTGANLTNADLQYAQVVNTRFDRVIAMTAKFDHANFARSPAKHETRLSGDFTDAHFDYAKGVYVRFDAGTEPGDKTGTSLRDANFLDTSFIYSTFSGVDLSGAKIKGADLTEDVFKDTAFNRAEIREAILNYSIFQTCDFSSSDIRDSYFEDTKFFNSTFRSTTSGTDEIRRFHGPGAVFGKDTLIENMKFIDADLRRARFENARLQNVLFSNSNLSDATFVDVDLSTVKFDGVDLRGADLNAARNVSPRLLRGACGNADTRLPKGLKIEACWKG